MRCNQCGNKNDSDAQYCIRCGMFLKDTMFCRQCGTQLDKHLEYCPQCRHKNPMYDATSSSFASKVIAADRTLTKIMLPFAIVFAVIAILVIVFIIILVMNLDTSVFSY